MVFNGSVDLTRDAIRFQIDIQETNLIFYEGRLSQYNSLSCKDNNIGNNDWVLSKGGACWQRKKRNMCSGV